jgi:hypothetical protein
VDAAVGGKIELCAAARAGQADMGEATLFLEAGAALFVERALARKQAFLPAGQEHVVEFEPLGRMQRHQRHRFFRGAAVAVHHQRDVLEKPCRFSNSSIERTSSFRLSSRPGGVGRAVLLPHLGVAALVEHDFGEFGVRRSPRAARASGRNAG